MSVINPLLENVNLPPITSESLYQWTWILKSKLWAPVQTFIDEQRDKATQALEFYSSHTKFPFSEVLEKWSMKIVSIEKTDFIQYVKATSESWEVFVCNPNDINNWILDSQDIFVIKESERNNSLLPFGSIVSNISDSEVKVFVKSPRFHEVLYDTYGYANTLQVQNQKLLGRYTWYNLPDFSMCRIRDLYVWSVLQYDTRI